MTSLTTRELLDAYASVGLDLFLDGDDNLRLRGDKGLRDAARPAIVQRKPELIQALREMRSEAVERVTRILHRSPEHAA